jgi:hypothetical protein
MATKQDIEKLSLALAKYMESGTIRDWETWIQEFMRAPLTSMEYAKVREEAKKITLGRQSPVMQQMKLLVRKST